MKLLDIFNVFRKKQEIVSELPQPSQLPDDFERFRVKRYPEAPPEPEYPSSDAARFNMPAPEIETPQIEPAVKEEPQELIQTDKIDLILQKLETIDTRLRLIEERTRK
ncbi:MAG: hypothetical protein KJ697_03090 [Nanoarchaeota archaeon]|nr:hypothetical protein [Nanoarchaeota archaeon]